MNWSRNIVVGFIWGDYHKGFAGSDLKKRNSMALLITRYDGVNPHGQFRDEELDYTSIGLSIAF